MPLRLGPDSDKQDMWKEILRLRKELEKERREREKQQQEINDYKKRHPETVGVKHGKPYAIQSPVQPRSPSGKKPGGQPGHRGRNRPLPQRIDQRVQLDTTCCPQCSNDLSAVQERRTRIVEDVPEPRSIVTEYQITRRWCRDCKKLVEPNVPGVLKGARIGTRAMLIVTWYRYAARLPEAVVVQAMQELHGITISGGEVQNILDQMAEAHRQCYDALLADLKARAAFNMDETSWRLNGQNQYLWAFVSKWEALFLVDQRRSHEVPLEFLGPDVQGTATVDGHSAYVTLRNKTKLKLQRCWTHVLGDSQELARHYGEEGQAIHDGLKRIYAKACSFEGKATPYQLKRLHDKLGEVLDKPFRSNHCVRFARNHLKKADDLFRFVTDPSVDGTNNRAERAIRPSVIARKISGGSRSAKGAQVRALLTSVLQSLRLQRQDFLQGAGLGPPPGPTSDG